MPGVQGVVAEPHLVERARAEVLDQHVRAGDERVEQPTPFGVLEVQRDAFLVAVDAQEVRALACDERRAPRAGVVAAAGPLDLDDAGAHVGELHRAVGS
jgi:hypothetical protein